MLEWQRVPALIRLLIMNSLIWIYTVCFSLSPIQALQNSLFKNDFLISQPKHVVLWAKADPKGVDRGFRPPPPGK